MSRLFITLTFPPDVGGMQTFAYARCLGAGDEPVVLAPWFTGCEIFDSVQPFRIIRWSPIANRAPGIRRVGQILMPLLTVRRLITRYNFDAVECWQPLPIGVVAWLLKHIYDLPVILWSHGSDLLRVQRIFGGAMALQFVLKSADRLIANSTSTRAEMIRLGANHAQIRVIHPTVDHTRFHPALDSTPIVERHSLKGHRVILTVSRLVEKKGVDTVLRALPSVIARVPNTVYVIVGDGPLRGALERLAERLSIAHHVRFVGWVDHHSSDLPLYYNACDVFAMPSRTIAVRGEVESFGITYLEAGACGRPVVAGHGGGTADAVENGVTGLLVDPLDVSALADTLVQLLQDDELSKRMGKAGRQKAMQEPAWEHLCFD